MILAAIQFLGGLVMGLSETTPVGMRTSAVTMSIILTIFWAIVGKALEVLGGLEVEAKKQNESLVRAVSALEKLTVKASKTKSSHVGTSWATTTLRASGN